MSLYNFKSYPVPTGVSNGNQFSPYSMNGGAVVAIAGEKFAMIGADTRLSENFSIITRNQNKLFKLSPTSVLGVTGCWGDAVTLSKIVEARITMYHHENQKDMSTPALAQMLATLLYYKRFFPYYVLNILAGLDEQGKGCVFCYDPIGHYERSSFYAVGSAGALLQPLLDNQIGMKNMRNVKQMPVEKDKAMSLIKDVFTCAAERDIYTGDSITIMTITDKGIKSDNFKLRKD